MKKNMSHEERLKKMKAAIELNKSDLLSGKQLPDDVTHIGSPKVINMSEEEIEECHTKEKDHDK